MTSEAQKKMTILVVDDNPSNLQVLLEHLKESGYKTLVARNGEGALRQADFAKPDLILLDVMMPPGIDGFETCRRLKLNDATTDIPVIFLTALSDTVDKIKGIEAGGVDYVPKPFEGAELLARVETHLKLSRYRKKLEHTHRELQEANEELLASRKQLELAAKIDPLTQLPNRRDMFGKIEYEKIRFERNHQPFTLALCDIDDLKRINNTFGHDCGDLILVTTARMMRSTIRKQDHLARWGGEEFLFAFPETDLEGAKNVCEKLRKKIAEHVIQYHNQQILVTMTFGVSEVDNYDLLIDDCIKQAAQALYMGKQRGKDCVILFEKKET